MANDFSGDSRCKALWRLESGALTADSKSTNTLTAVNTPTADTGDKKEGGASVNLSSSYPGQFLKIADTDLAADFPFKYEGGDQTVQKVTFCGWFKATTLSGPVALFGKHASALYGIGLKLHYATLYLRLDGDVNPTFSSLSTGVWYHIALRFNAITGEWSVRLFNATTLATSNANGILANPLNINNYEFRVGAYADLDTSNTFNGHIDEVVVFNDILSNSEIDAIRAGTFPPPPSIEIDGVGTDVVYEAPANVEVDALCVQVAYDLAGALEIDGSGITVVYSDKKIGGMFIVF
jgi:hypothetical protein